MLTFNIFSKTAWDFNWITEWCILVYTYYVGWYLWNWTKKDSKELQSEQIYYFECTINLADIILYEHG